MAARDEVARTVVRVLAVAAIGIAVADIGQRFADGTFRYLLWSDRDLWRSARLFVDGVTTGAELNYGSGARVPGGAYHLLTWLALLPTGEPTAAYRFWLLMEAAALGLVSWTSWRLHGPLAAAIAALTFVASSGARQPLVWLWNPSALPIFLALAVALVPSLLDNRKAWPWVAWTAALALGAQAHLTAGAWAVSALIGLAVVTPGATLRRLPWIVGTWLVTAIPYLVGEAVRGWPNTRAMQDQGPVQTVKTGSTLTFQVDELWDSAAYLVPGSAPSSPEAVVAVAGTGIVVALAALTAAARAFRPGGEPTLRVLAIATALVVAIPALDAGIHVEYRYLLVAMPGFCVLAGVGVGRLVDEAPILLRPFAAVGITAVAATIPLAQIAHRADRDESGTIYSWEGIGRIVAGLREATGWSLTEVAGRTAFLRAEDEGWTWVLSTPIDYPMLQVGERFPGSLTPPCAMVFGDLREGGVRPDASVVALNLGRPVEEVTVHEVIDIAHDVQILRYTPADGLCPTTMSSRYVLTPEEEEHRPLFDVLSDSEVVPLPAPDGAQRVAVMVESAPSLMDPGFGRVLLDWTFTPTPGGVGVTLQSNQLRGRSFNGGWFNDGWVDDVVLRFTPEGGEPIVVPFQPTPLGASWIATPLHLDASLPAGTYAVALQIRVLGLPESHFTWPLEAVGERSVDVVLAPALPIP